VSLSKLLDQGYKVDEWTKTHLKISRSNKTTVIKKKGDQQMFYLLGFEVQSEVDAIGTAMVINMHMRNWAVLGRHLAKNNDLVVMELS